MGNEYRLYYVRDDAVARFEHGERSGRGISTTIDYFRGESWPDDFAGTAPQYASYRDALNRLVEFATWHAGYDWDRMDDDWTPEDGSLGKMLKDRNRDFKKHQQCFAEEVRRAGRMRWRSGWILIGETEV